MVFLWFSYGFPLNVTVSMQAFELAQRVKDQGHAVSLICGTPGGPALKFWPPRCDLKGIKMIMVVIITIMMVIVMLSYLKSYLLWLWLWWLFWLLLVSYVLSYLIIMIVMIAIVGILVITNGMTLIKCSFHCYYDGKIRTVFPGW